jgi:zinc/manganese transport system permease protein
MGALASLAGLLLSYHADLPAGPAVVLSAGALWLGSVIAGPRASLLLQVLRRPHLAG